jgi:hypothetical protein
MMVWLKAVFAAIGFPAYIVPRMMTNPVINELTVLFRPELLY